MAGADRISALEKKLADAQNQINAIQAELVSLKKETGAPAAKPKPAPVTPAAPKKPSIEWEFLFGGNILGKAGILSIVIALSWFVKYAFDNHWVNESGKIFSGLLISSTLGFLGLHFAKKKFQALPLALLGGAIAGYLISVFTAYYAYNLIGRTEAFVYLAITLLTGFTLAYRTRSQSLFIFSLLGSFGLPVAFSQGENSYRFLFSYLFLVNLGYHFIQRQFHWRISSAVMAVLNIATWSAWFAVNGHESSFLFPFSYLSLTSVAYLYSENPFRALERGKWAWVALTCFLVFLIFYGVAGYALVQLYHPDYAAHFLVALTLLPVQPFALSGSLLKNAREKFKAYPGVLLFVAFQVCAFTALSAYFESNDLTLAQLGLLAFSLHLFTARGFTVAYIASLWPALFFIMRLFALDFETEAMPFLNYRFGIFALATAVFAYAHWGTRSREKAWYWKIPGGLAVTVLIFGTAAQVDMIVTDTHYRNLGYSYVLGFYTAAFLLRGFLKQDRFLRQIGFVLAVLLVLKLYLYDIWTLSLLARILAGLSLGAGLVVLSLMYQKFREQFMKSFGKTVGVLVIFSALAGASALRAEGVKGYHYVKKIQPVDKQGATDKRLSGFGRLRIDDEIYRHAGEYDIRLKFKDRLLPYLVRSDEIAGKAPITKDAVVTYSDATDTQQTYVVRLPNLPEGYVYESLQLERGDTFEANVNVYAIQDKTTNFLGEQKLYRYRDDQNLKVRLDTPEIQSVRLEISPPGQFDFGQARARVPNKEAELQLPVDLASLKTDLNKDTKYSVFYFNNPDGRKLSRVRMQFKEPKYQRKVKVYEQTSGSHRYHLVDRRTISRGRGEPQDAAWVEFAFNGNRARKLKIEVEYGDDSPLTLAAFETWSLAESIIFEIPSELKSDESILMYYGNSYARAPAYDLGSRYKATQVTIPFAAEKEEKNPDFGYSFVEPPFSAWIIRISFGVLLAALTFLAWRIFGKYAADLEKNPATPAAGK